MIGAEDSHQHLMMGIFLYSSYIQFSLMYFLRFWLLKKSSAQLKKSSESYFYADDEMLPL